MLDGAPEGFDRLPRQVAPARVDGGERDPARDLRRDVERCGNRGLRVQRVEHCLDHQEVDTAFDESGHLLGVGGVDLIERDGAERRVFHLRRQRERDVERADAPGDEPARLVGRLPGEPGAGDVHLGHPRLEAIVGLPDGGGRERVRRRDAGARSEVGAVDVEDDLRIREVEQVGVARHVARVVAEPFAPVCVLPAHLALDQHPPRAVKEHDLPLEERRQSLGRAHAASIPVATRFAGSSYGRPATASWFSAWRMRCSSCQRSASDSPASTRSRSACCLLQLLLRARSVDLACIDGVVDERESAILLHLEEACARRELDHVPLVHMHARRAGLQHRDERRVTREHADLTGGARHDDHLREAFVRRALRRHERDLE